MAKVGEITYVGKMVPKKHFAEDGRSKAMQHLDFDLIEARILEGDSEEWTQKALAEHFGVSQFTMFRFLNLPAYRERYEKLKQFQARMWADQGWIELQGTTDSNWNANLMKARSEYCQFMAKIYDQNTYGSKHETTVIAITTPEDRAKKIQEIQAKMKQLGPAQNPQEDGE